MLRAPPYLCSMGTDALTRMREVGSFGNGGRYTYRVGRRAPERQVSPLCFGVAACLSSFRFASLHLFYIYFPFHVIPSQISSIFHFPFFLPSFISSLFLFLLFLDGTTQAHHPPISQPDLLLLQRRRRPGVALHVRAPDADDARARGCEACV
ncbi:hypothetical protein FB451DRAFT_1297275 [Mycena latifolia]|nr:hypothetical protein FB451DRAFT_1297275 [Mycena latifolia]